MQLTKWRALAGFILLTLSGCYTAKSTLSSQSKDGFVAIFDGKTLNGWEGDSVYWSVRNGILTGEITPATIVKRNTFIIWRGGTPADFELRLDYRISEKGNSGVNYRSSEIDTLKYALKGYQADIDGSYDGGLGYPKYAGQNYEERGRAFLAWRGQRTVLEAGKKPLITDSVGSQKDLGKIIKTNDWNHLVIVAKDNNLKHYINGKLMSEVTDNDTANRKMSGLIGVQVHVGPPMKVEYRNILLKEL